jgi:hypothetical protein
MNINDCSEFTMVDAIWTFIFFFILIAVPVCFIGLVTWFVARKIYSLKEANRQNDPYPLDKVVRLTEDEWQFCQRHPGGASAYVRTLVQQEMRAGRRLPTGIVRVGDGYRY